MSASKRYRCLNCGERFICEVLSPEEVRDAQRLGRHLSSVHCPKCNRTYIERDR